MRERESERKSGRGWERVGEGGRVREWESENLYGQLKSPLLFLSFFKFSDFYLGISSMNSKLSRWGWGKNKSGLFRCPAILSYCHFVSLFVWHSKEPLFYRDQTSLSSYIWHLKDLGADFSTRWSVVRHAQAHRAGDKICSLCLAEKLAILHGSRDKECLNKRNELFNKCRHRNRVVLAAFK